MSHVAGDDSRKSPLLAGAARDVFAGAVISLLSIAYGLSYAALIFSGPLATALGYGIAATFLTTAVSAAVVALRSSLPFAVAGADSSVSAVTAALVAALLAPIARGASAEHLVVPALIVMALSAALTGLVLCALGLTRAGRAIRFVPYPVIGGFLGATGWVMVNGAVQVITDNAVNVANLPVLFGPHNLAALAAGGGVALAFHLGLQRPRSSLVLPGILVACVVATHIGFLLTKTSIAQAAADGWVFRPQTASGLMLPWHAAALREFPWQQLPALSGDLLAVIFVTAVSILLNTTGIEFALRREADLERELNANGIANLVSAALGGYASCTSLSRTTLNHAAGGRGRLSGLTTAAIAAALLLSGPGILSYVPKFVLGGLLLYFGVSLMIRWLVESARRLSPIEYVSLLAIAAIIVQWGFIAGVLIGVVIGCATFALSASQVNAVKFSFDGSELRSSLDRSADELALLGRHGGELQGMSLQSYLFFGSAARLYQHVKTLLAEHPDCRFLVFDFRHVTGLDSSATHSFAQIRQVAADIGARLVLVQLSREIEAAFRASRFIDADIALASDLDRALEACENAIIEAHRAEGGGTHTLTEWLAVTLGSQALAERLAGCCERREVAVGERIARQGDAADGMHFILEGRVGVVVEMADGRVVRVRSLGPHTTIGEMGLITRQPRSANIEAEAASVLYWLPVETYERIVRSDPPLALALLTYIVGIMSERLSFASRLIGVLHR